MENQSKKVTLKSIVFLQLIVIIYTFYSVFSKMSRGYDFLSGMFILFFFLAIAMLGIYALFWQQALKRFDLHVAYTNRMLAIIWAMVWSALIFQERITVQNIIGTALIVTGAIVVNTDA